MNLGGSLTRQVEQDSPVSEASPHIANIGRMVEDMENKIRYVYLKGKIEKCYFIKKTPKVIVFFILLFHIL